MKKIFALILVLSLVFTMAACGGKTESASSDSGDKVKITVFQQKTEITEQLMACAEAFQEETGIEVEVWETSGDKYFTDLKTKLTSNQGPTVFSISPGSEVEQLNAYLTDLSDIEAAGKVFDGMQVTYQDKTVGIPFTVEGFGLLVNESLVTDQDLKDTDSLLAYINKNKGKDSNGMELSEESYFLIGHMLNTPFSMQDDPDAYLQSVLDGKTRLADNKAFQDFAKIYESIRDNTSSVLGRSYDEACGDFATGKTGIIHQGNWSYSMFDSYDVNFDMKLAPVPVSGNDSICVAVPSAWAVNSQASEAEITAGKQFVNWLYTSETGTDYLMNKFGFIPTVEGMTSDSMNPINQSVADYVANGKTIGWSLNSWPAGIIDTYLAPVAQEFLSTDMTTTEFLDKLNDAFVNAK